ncbi:MAG TPA: ATP-binding protein [Solirubrobacteraceae bacterium]|nr:ATP-binding protein [Solirubrobacteraceae bacterium]
MPRPPRPPAMPRPLDPLSSIKVKLGVVIVVGVVVSDVAGLTAVRHGIPLVPAALLAAAIALALVQILARGLTAPLREMAQASRRLRKGDFTVRVADARTDEVGELARAFNAMAAALAEVDRQRRDLVANVSHELRTPITALQAKLENVADGVEQADPETVETMLAQVARLGRLVEQLLDLSRLEAQAEPFDRRPFAVCDVLEEVAREARLNVPAGLELRVEAPEELRASGDPERIHQVVANLVENAVRHAPVPGEIVLRARPGRGSWTVLEVQDAGPGIPPGEAERVFERFYRPDAARSGAAGGAGLGLSIAKWIVDLHGGTIRAEQAEPHGARMVVELPAPAAPAPAKDHRRKERA